MTRTAVGHSPVPRPAVGSTRSWFTFLAGFAVLCVVLLGTSAVDATGRWGPAILAAVLLPAVVVERVRRPSSIPDVLRRLGLGRPAGRILAVAAAVSALVVLVVPVTAALSGTAIPLRPDWPWLLVGVFAFHGLAEEQSGGLGAPSSLVLRCRPRPPVDLLMSTQRTMITRWPCPILGHPTSKITTYGRSTNGAAPQPDEACRGHAGQRAPAGRRPGPEGPVMGRAWRWLAA